MSSKSRAMTFPEHWRIALSEAGQIGRKAAMKAVERERLDGQVVYPSAGDTFNALGDMSPEDVKVVIIGQDPYHGEGQAHGYAFSVPYGIKVPPSLVNIYKSLESEIEGFRAPQHGNLVPWAKQGVLLLNTVFTVRAREAASHQGYGWEAVTRDILEFLAKGEPKVFVLWGGHAKRVMKGIDTSHQVVLEGTHPSPLSAYRGFFDEQHFSRMNQELKAMGKKQIDWTAICDDLFV